MTSHDASAPERADRTARADGQDRVICVDLDGTLVATDLLWECTVSLLRERPWLLAALPFWLLAGKARFKQRVAARASLDVANLPWRTDVLQYLRAEHAAGRRVILATAADESIARRVADHLGIFSDVLASDGRTNLAGAAKQHALEATLAGAPYCYIGDHAIDLPLWQRARSVMLVAPSARLLDKVRATIPVEKVFAATPPSRTRTLLRALRVRQWIKNILVVVPVLLDHRVTDVAVLANAYLAFFAFSFAASGGYVLNDILDVDVDRRHATKRHRPFATGALSLRYGAVLVPLLFGAALAISLVALPPSFLWLLSGYVVLTSAYSLYLKRIPVLDVILLAGLYTLRLLAGIAATEVRFSTWLLAFSMFLFLSLAFMKRFAELFRSGRPAHESLERRGYIGADLDWLRSMGGASGYLAVLVLALYISSDEVTILYRKPHVLWLVCPLLLLWITRMWFHTNRGHLHEDPIVATMKDPVNYVIGAMVLGVMVAAL